MVNVISEERCGRTMVQYSVIKAALASLANEWQTLNSHKSSVKENPNVFDVVDRERVIDDWRLSQKKTVSSQQ